MGVITGMGQMRPRQPVYVINLTIPEHFKKNIHQKISLALN
jgi:hypothetical protein